MGRRKKAGSNRRQERRDEEHVYKLAILREFVGAHGWSEVRAKTIYKGVNVFSWVQNRRSEYRLGTIRDFLVSEVESIPGWSWDPHRDRYQRDVENLRRYIAAHGWDAITVETEIDGVKVSQWCANRRMEFRRATMSSWLRRAIEAIPGWSWEPIEEHYAERIASLREHIERNGWGRFRQQTIDRYGVRLGKWANHIREMHRRGRLPSWVVDELDSGRRLDVDAASRTAAKGGPRCVSQPSSTEL